MQPFLLRISFTKEIQSISFLPFFYFLISFFTAPQIQSGLAQGLNATFLVSGYHQPSGGQLGSGIFQGMKDH